MEPPDSHTTKELLAVLSTKYSEQEDSQFPDVNLPQEYAELYAEWAEMDGFVAGLAQRVLADERLDLSLTEPFGYDELKQRLEGFRRKYPEVAPPVLERFQLFDSILDLIRRIIKLRETELSD